MPEHPSCARRSRRPLHGLFLDAHGLFDRAFFFAEARHEPVCAIRARLRRMARIGRIGGGWR
jgi:hypothetical protein